MARLFDRAGIDLLLVGGTARFTLNPKGCSSK